VNDVRTFFIKQKRERQKKEFELKDDPEDLESDLPDDSTIAA